MLIHLENEIGTTNIDFVFDTQFIHHIEKQEGMNDNMVLVLDSGICRVITKKQYKNILKELESSQEIIYA